MIGFNARSQVNMWYFSHIVSDPRSTKYGRHLDRRELASFLRVSDEATNLIEAWLISNNVANFTKFPGNDWIKASLPARQAETLLQCRYFEFKNIQDGTLLVRTTEWSMPERIAPYVDVIQPTDSFFRPKPSNRYGGPPPPDWELQGRLPTHAELAEEDIIDRGYLDIPKIDELPANPTVKDACNRLAVSPLCMRVLYGTLSYQPQSIATNSMASSIFWATTTIGPTFGASSIFTDQTQRLLGPPRALKRCYLLEQKTSKLPTPRNNLIATWGWKVLWMWKPF